MPKIQYKEIKFRGRSLELINLVNQVINEYKNQGYELTLRQTYYQLVARGYIPNNERTPCCNPLRTVLWFICNIFAAFSTSNRGITPFLNSAVGSTTTCSSDFEK